MRWAVHCNSQVVDLDASVIVTLIKEHDDDDDDDDVDKLGFVFIVCYPAGSFLMCTCHYHSQLKSKNFDRDTNRPDVYMYITHICS